MLIIISSPTGFISVIDKMIRKTIVVAVDSGYSNSSYLMQQPYSIKICHTEVTYELRLSVIVIGFSYFVIN